MGTWNVSIFSDDEALDVYERYRSLYNEGAEHEEVLEQMKQESAESLNDSDDGPIFWFAVARAQWEFGELDPDVLRHVEEIDAEGLGLDRWREAGPRVLAKREKVVREFLEKIRQPNPKPKKRKVEKRFPPIFQRGDCLAIELSDGKFGAAIVLETDASHVQGFDWLVYLDWHDNETPPLSFYEKRRWVSADGGWIDRACWIFASTYRTFKKHVRHIEHVPARPDDPKSKVRNSGGWDSVARALERHYGVEA
jgi:hypothetical protein